jgi:hypothetical protein
MRIHPTRYRLPATCYLLLIVAAFLLSSCHKNCVCTRFDGQQTTYSADDFTGSCENMVYQSGVIYYSVCDWE